MVASFPLSSNQYHRGGFFFALARPTLRGAHTEHDQADMQHDDAEMNAETMPTTMLGDTQQPPTMPPSPPSETPPTDSASACDVDVDDDNETDAPPPPPPPLHTRLLRSADGLRVLRAEADALARLAELYGDESSGAPEQFSRAVGCIARSRLGGGKLVTTGVGKSAHVARKVAATCQSLGVAAVFVHATEALHGDMGVAGRADTLLVVSASGATAELEQLLAHAADPEPGLAVVVVASAPDPPLLAARPRAVLLPAPVPVPEAVALGVAAPTTSTTVALALGDALALAAAREIHGDRLPAVFARNHPGGSIGLSFK